MHIRITSEILNKNNVKYGRQNRLRLWFLIPKPLPNLHEGEISKIENILAILL